jgi:hypothetical protein
MARKHEKREKIHNILELGKLRLTIRKPSRKIAFKIPYDMSVAQMEDEWRKMGLGGDIEAEKLYFSAKLDRFLNKYVILNK